MGMTHDRREILFFASCAIGRRYPFMATLAGVAAPSLEQNVLEEKR